MIIKRIYLKYEKKKEFRKCSRLLNRRFKLLFSSRKNGMEPPSDPEIIENDPKDFDYKNYERELLKLIQISNKIWLSMKKL